MKILVLAFTLLTSSFGLFAQSGALEIGATIPMADVKMKSVDGKEISIKDQVKKNGVLVMFSCNTCPYVVKYQKRTQDILNEAKKNDIGVIIINSNEDYRKDQDSYEHMKSYAKAQNYTAPYVVDPMSKAADAFGATRTPECFLFNNKGKLVYHGAIDDNPDATKAERKHLAVAFTEAAAGKDITVKETRSIGCMIKRLEQ